MTCGMMLVRFARMTRPYRFCLPVREATSMMPMESLRMTVWGETVKDGETVTPRAEGRSLPKAIIHT